MLARALRNLEELGVDECCLCSVCGGLRTAWDGVSESNV